MNTYSIKSRTIHVVSSFKALHHWPEAPEAVSFLRSLHMHDFNVRIDVPVVHNDRHLEFIMVQDQLSGVLHQLVSRLRNEPRMSCEDMAEFIFRHLSFDHNITCSKVYVDEDGGNGATLEFESAGTKTPNR